MGRMPHLGVKCLIVMVATVMRPWQKEDWAPCVKRGGSAMNGDGAGVRRLPSQLRGHSTGNPMRLTAGYAGKMITVPARR